MLLVSVGLYEGSDSTSVTDAVKVVNPCHVAGTYQMIGARATMLLLAHLRPEIPMCEGDMCEGDECELGM